MPSVVQIKQIISTENIKHIADIVYQWVMHNGWVTILLVIAAWYALKYFIKFARIAYAHFSARNNVFMKVTLPRSDSKMDQEQRVEKDF